MMVRVRYPNGVLDEVNADLLDELIKKHKIVQFYRSGKWVKIGKDQVRTEKRVYYDFG